MPKVILAGPLTRHVQSERPGACTYEVAATTVREAIEEILVTLPTLRGYLLDERGALRHHLAAFVDGVVIHDKQGLHDPIPVNGELYLVPALSGG